MALIHHQCETIHPFYDGKGRTGRIIKVLYLVKEGLLEIPVLYLSSHIVRTKVTTTGYCRRCAPLTAGRNG
jgi:Fic family protein